MKHNQLLSALYKAYYLQYSGPDAYPLHDHHGYGEVFWCDGGSLTHFINGSKVRMKEGDLVFIRPWDQHSLGGPRNHPFRLMLVCFAWHTYGYLKQRYWNDDPSIYGEELALPRMFRLNKKQMQWLRHSFFTIHKAPPSLLQIEAFLGSLFGELCSVPKEVQIDESAMPDWLMAAVRAIRQPEHFCLGATELYRLCGRSPEHVTRTFRRVTGTTPGKYVNQLRMLHAAALLTGTSQSILDIGQECGFDSASAFYTSFHHEFGIAPRAYRLRALTHSMPLPHLPPIIAAEEKADTETERAQS